VKDHTLDVSDDVIMARKPVKDHVTVRRISDSAVKSSSSTRSTHAVIEHERFGREAESTKMIFVPHTLVFVVVRGVLVDVMS
jgi:hypothetical protein